MAAHLLHDARITGVPRSRTQGGDQAAPSPDTAARHQDPILVRIGGLADLIEEVDGGREAHAVAGEPPRPDAGLVVSVQDDAPHKPGPEIMMYVEGLNTSG